MLAHAHVHFLFRCEKTWYSTRHSACFLNVRIPCLISMSMLTCVADRRTPESGCGSRYRSQCHDSERSPCSEVLRWRSEAPSVSSHTRSSRTPSASALPRHLVTSRRTSLIVARSGGSRALGATLALAKRDMWRYNPHEARHLYPG